MGKFGEILDVDDVDTTTADTGNWESWLKPVGVGIGAVNMGLNVGMYGDKKRNLKAQTNYYNTQITDLNDKITDRKEVRKHNREVMR